MDPKKTGAFISKMRKEHSMTQAVLAEKLNISNRTISKWENGDGFPDITILPDIAEIFGITVDELLAGEKKPSDVADIKVTEIENKDNLLNIFQISYIISLFFAVFGAILGTVTEIYSTWAFNILFYTHWEIIFVAGSFVSMSVSALVFAVGVTRLNVSFDEGEVKHISAKKGWLIALLISTLPVAFLVRIVDCSKVARHIGLTPAIAFAVLLVLVISLFLFLWKRIKSF